MPERKKSKKAELIISDFSEESDPFSPWALRTMDMENTTILPDSSDDQSLLNSSQNSNNASRSIFFDATASNLKMAAMIVKQEIL